MDELPLSLLCLLLSSEDPRLAIPLLQHPLVGGHLPGLRTVQKLLERTPTAAEVEGDRRPSLVLVGRVALLSVIQPQQLTYLTTGAAS